MGFTNSNKEHTEKQKITLHHKIEKHIIGENESSEYLNKKHHPAD